MRGNKQRTNAFFRLKKKLGRVVVVLVDYHAKKIIIIIIVTR